MPVLFFQRTGNQSAQGDSATADGQGVQMMPVAVFPGFLRRKRDEYVEQRAEFRSNRSAARNPDNS